MGRSFQIPPVFDGQHLVVYGVLKRGSTREELPHCVVLHGRTGSQPLSMEIPFDQSNCAAGKLLHRYLTKISFFRAMDEN